MNMCIICAFFASGVAEFISVHYYLVHISHIIEDEGYYVTAGYPPEVHYYG